jgi:hypothetical protein
LRLRPVTLLLAALALVWGAARSNAATTTVDVTLTWTAPGDDSLSGTANRYDMRYSTLPITAENFDGATVTGNLPAPAAPGTSQSVTVPGLATGSTYFFAIKTMDASGNWSAISNIAVRTDGVLGVSGQRAGVHFSAPSPNPARGSTRFAISLPQPSHIKVEAFDVMGRRVRMLADGQRQSGPSDLSWDLTDDHGRALAAGVYMVRATLGATEYDRRVVVIH